MTFILKYLFAFLLLFSSVFAQADDVWVIEVNGGIVRRPVTTSLEK